MNIIYEDEYLLVLDKPAGLPVLPDGWEKDAPYLVKMLEEEYGKIWIVHRLDKITSGVMVFARDAETHRTLNIQFEERQAEKVYHAIVEGIPQWNEKIAKHPLRINVGHKHRTGVSDKYGKPSETRFKVIKRYQAPLSRVEGLGFDRSEASDGENASDTESMLMRWAIRCWETPCMAHLKRISLRGLHCMRTRSLLRIRRAVNARRF